MTAPTAQQIAAWWAAGEQRRAARRARRALEDRLERSHKRRPCHRDDWACTRERSCWTHQETEQYVDRVLARFDRLKARHAP